jgi:sec-independent protein translocase protein TatA
MGIFGNLTGWHLLAIVFLVLLLFGAPKLPGLAKSVGQSLKIFKNEVKSDKVDGDHAAAADAQVPTQQPAAQVPAQQPATVQQAPAQQPVAQPYVAPQAPQAEPAPVLSAPPVQPAPHGEATSAGAQNAESHQKN